MKKLMILLKIIISVQFILLLFSCSDNPVENIDPPSIDIISQPPYNNPIWHPHDLFIGFNYTPLVSIKDGKQYFNHDSTGFWLINVDGTNKRRILPHQLQTPAWSPDGNWVAFVLGAQIYKMPFNVTEEKFDTTQIEQLTAEGRNFFPAWSHDGEWIAYDSNIDSPAGGYRIWKMKFNGVDKSHTADGRMPCWSNDVKWIFYIGFHREIFKVNATNNTEVVKITHLNEINIYATDNRYPKISPSSLKIAYASQPDGELMQIRLIDLSNKNNRKLTSKGVSDHIFSWSPDGEKIVYTQHNYSKRTYDNGVLWIIDINTGIEHQLTFNTEK